jgi:nicotinic acid mononucleotide adenylyltransferase
MYKFIFILILLITTASADTILYPGTFDPFHLSHFDEVSHVLESDHDAHVMILPIEQGYYNPPIPNTEIYLPHLLPYFDRIKLINATFENQKRVQTSDKLRLINDDVIYQLISLKIFFLTAKKFLLE